MKMSPLSCVPSPYLIRTCKYWEHSESDSYARRLEKARDDLQDLRVRQGSVIEARRIEKLNGTPCKLEGGRWLNLVRIRFETVSVVER